MPLNNVSQGGVEGFFDIVDLPPVPFEVNFLLIM